MDQALFAATLTLPLFMIATLTWLLLFQGPIIPMAVSEPISVTLTSIVRAGFRIRPPFPHFLTVYAVAKNSFGLVGNSVKYFSV